MTRNLLMVNALLAVVFVSSTTFSQSESTSNTDEFAIYTLADKNLTVKDVDEYKLQDLILSETPLLTTSDIVSYARCKHALTVTQDAVSRLNELPEYPTFRNGIPFIVTIGGDRSYLGTFWPFTSSSITTVPYILLPTLAEFQIRIFDRRDDRRIFEAFQSRGILKD